MKSKPDFKAGQVLSETEAELGSLHDCHVHGFRWRRENFIFAMDIQFILEWIQPSPGSTGYRFLVSEARLIFRSASDLKLSLDWSGAALDSQISTMSVVATRATPNGLLDRCFEVEFSDLDGNISLWSTGYEVQLLRDPVMSDVPSIAIVEEL